MRSFRDVDYRWEVYGFWRMVVAQLLRINECFSVIIFSSLCFPVFLSISTVRVLFMVVFQHEKEADKSFWLLFVAVLFCSLWWLREVLAFALIYLLSCCFLESCVGLCLCFIRDLFFWISRLHTRICSQPTLTLSYLADAGGWVWLGAFLARSLIAVYFTFYF